MMFEGLLLCNQVEIQGKAYPINTSWRLWVEIEGLLLDGEGNQGQKLAKILSLAYPKLPPHPKEALDALMWFYMGGRERHWEGDSKCGAPACDLRQDFPYIWADFLGRYGIDLMKSNLHWWQFCWLLGALDGDSRFMRIAAFRTADISSVKNKEQRRFIEKMKKKYRLRDPRSEEQRAEHTAEVMEAAF